MIKRTKMIFIIIGSLVAIGFALFYFSTERFAQFGNNPEGVRLERMKKSPHFNGEEFINENGKNVSPGLGMMIDIIPEWLFGKEIREPGTTLPVNFLNESDFDNNAEELRVVWMGHSSVLIEIDGYRILTDPVWSERCSPSSIYGPKRFHPVPIEIEQLPKLDAVIISHNHYDHLDKNALTKLSEKGTIFLVPLGVGAHLEGWGIDSSQIVEFDWWDEYTIEGTDLKLAATPAQHFSGRGMFTKRNASQWLTWAILGKTQRVFFCGDTGEFPGLAEIGEKYGPFDICLMKIGAYGDNWPDLHLTPEQSVRVHQMLKGDLFIPIHWGTFNLAFHDWFDPPERLLDAVADNKIKLAIPKPGQPVVYSDPPELDYWWRGYLPEGIKKK